MVVLRGYKVLSIELDTVFFMKEKAQRKKKLEEKARLLHETEKLSSPTLALINIKRFF